MKIGVIGGGVVGRAMARCFMEWAEVCVHDVDPLRSTHPYGETLGCDLIFVCLPTPQGKGGRTDLRAVEGFFANLKSYDLDRNYILKSTVPVGTTRHLAQVYHLPNLVHSPEFLTARRAVTDAQIPARNIIGAPAKSGGHLWSGTNSAAQTLNILYHQRFPGVPVYLMSSDESEAVKLLVNGFFSVKIAYFNEAWSLCHELGLRWANVLEAMLSDGRIAHSHTMVPGPDGKHGFGGECLPKDLASLVMLLEDNGLRADVTAAALERNELDRKISAPPDAGCPTNTEKATPHGEAS